MRKKNANTLYDVGADFGEKRNQYEKRGMRPILSEICSANKIFVPRKEEREREEWKKRRTGNGLKGVRRRRRELGCTRTRVVPNDGA